MADNKVQVDLVAENRDLNAKLAEAEARLAALGQKGGKQAAAGIGEATTAAKTFRQALQFIAFPAIIWESAHRLANWLLDASERTKKLKEEADGVAKAFLDASRNAQQLAAGGKARVEDAKSGDEERAVKAKLDEQEAERRKDAERKLAAELADINATKGINKARARAQAIDDNAKELAAIKKEFDARRGAITLGAAKEKEARDESSRRSLQTKLVGQRVQLAPNDPALRAQLELEESLAQIKLQVAGETNAKLLEMWAEYTENVRKLNKQALDKMADDQAKQLREMLEAQKKAQSEGFTIRDLNTNNLGSGAALQIIGQQLPALVTLGGGGR